MGVGSVPALLLLLVGLALAVAAWIFFPGEGADPGSAPPAQPGEGSGAKIEPGSLSDPGAISEREAPWEPAGVLPPDSPYRSGVRPTAALVRGRVTLRAIEAWPHRVEVWLERQSDGSEFARVQPTRESPAFRFEQVPFGAYRLRLEADGVTPITMLISASVSSPDQFQDLPMRPAAGVNGVVRTAGGDLAPGVPVTVEPIPRTPRDLVTPITTWTIADGSFLVQGLTEGEYAVYPGPARSPVGERVVIRVGSDGALAWAALLLPPLGSARVVVEDPQKLGFTGVQVKAQRMRLAAGQLPYEETRPLGDDGAVRFNTLPPGEYAFTAWGEGFPQTLREARVTAELEPEVRIPLRPDPRGLPPR